MRMSFFRLHHRLIVLLLVLLVFILGYFFIGWPQTRTDQIRGITWSDEYAEYLGVDSDKGLAATLDELGVRHFRIPVYWNRVQTEPGKFDWSSVDKQLDAIAARGGTVILAIGGKLPRWPECRFPSWVQTLKQTDREKIQLAYVEQAYRHFATNPTVVAWQIENEPLLSFGDCLPIRKAAVVKEIQSVREQETKNFPADQRRPVYITDSGELSTWLRFAGLTDGLGISVYRVIGNKWFGKQRYWFLPPWAYARKAQLVKSFTGPIYVSEFQMEPWTIGGVKTTPLVKQFDTFDLVQMKSNFHYASQLDFPSVYFWGAEWWYWMKEKKSHPEFWEEAKGRF